jgi:hypothetical protein
MKIILLSFAVIVSLASTLHSADIVVNAIPGDAQFVNYGAIDWKGATIVPDGLKDISEAVSSATEQAKTVASGAGADLVVIISPQTGVIIPQRIVQEEIRLRQKDPILVAVFYKMKSGRKASPEEQGIRFTTTALPKTERGSIDLKIERVADTADVTLSYWVYLNLPRFVAEASKQHFDTIMIKSSEDADCEDVWLPGCDAPLRISKKRPLIECSIYQKRG